MGVMGPVMPEEVVLLSTTLHLSLQPTCCAYGGAQAHGHGTRHAVTLLVTGPCETACRSPEEGRSSDPWGGGGGGASSD